MLCGSSLCKTGLLPSLSCRGDITCMAVSTDLNPLRLDVKGNKRNEPLAEQLANDLAHPAEASNDDVVPHLLAGTLIWLHCL